MARRRIFWALIAVAVLTALGGYATRPRDPAVIAIMAAAIVFAPIVALRWWRP